ncbi:MAG: divergent polysaccharide deacetylase family protein [Candidatus Binataceae bacterium]
MSSSRKPSPFHARPGFLIAGAVALLGFGAVMGIGFDLVTRPNDPEPVSRAVAEPAHASLLAAPPKVVLPEAGNQGSILQTQGEARRAWAPEPAAETTEAKGAPPWVAFAVPATAAPTSPALAIVIDDMGVDRTHALEVIAIPGPLTLSLMTYAADLPGLAARAHAAGHEILAHLPMEPRDTKEYPGPGALLTKMDEATIRSTLAHDLDSWNGYVGVNNHMGSRFTADRARMAVVMSELKARGLMWLDSITIGASTGPATAEAAGVPFIARDVFLDNEESVSAVIAQLDRAKAVAKSHGTAVAIGHPHETTIAALKQWLPGLSASGVALVPATEILRRARSIHAHSAAVAQ